MHWIKIIEPTIARRSIHVELATEGTNPEDLHVLPLSEIRAGKSRIAIVNINPGERVRGVSSEWEITIARARSAGR